MKFTFTTLFLTVTFLFVNCSKSDSSKSTSIIDYAALTSLSVTTELEIGESEHFLPGDLSSLLVSTTGDIVVADRGNVSIEQFDADGNYKGRVAFEGEGPGEISGYINLRNLGNDTLLVNSTNGTISKFGANSDGFFTFVSDEKLDQNGSSFSVLSSLESDKYLASKRLVIRDITRYLQNKDDYNVTTYGIINSDGTVENDSLFSLKNSTPHIVQSNEGGISVNTVPFRFNDKISVFKDGTYLIARIDSGFAKLYNHNHLLKKTIPLHIKERKLTDSEIEYALQNIDDSIKNDIKKRIGEVKPPFTSLWTSSNKIWLLTDSNEFGKEIVVLDLAGNALGKLSLSEYDRIHYVEGNSIYTIHKSPKIGDTIRKYNIGF